MRYIELMRIKRITHPRPRPYHPNDNLMFTILPFTIIVSPNRKKMLKLSTSWNFGTHFITFTKFRHDMPIKKITTRTDNNIKNGLWKGQITSVCPKKSIQNEHIDFIFRRIRKDLLFILLMSSSIDFVHNYQKM